MQKLVGTSINWRRWRAWAKESKISLAKYVWKRRTPSRIASLPTLKEIEDMKRPVLPILSFDFA